MIPADPLANLGPATIIRGNARALPLPDASVDLVVTSPPYFALRSYTDGGAHYDGQLGSEATPAEFVEALLECTREMVRVLKPTGSIWINLGDKFSQGEPYDNTLTLGDAAWLAGLIDADGTITVRRTQQPSMRAPTFEGIVAVEQMDREAVERAAAITGRGKVHTVSGSRGRPMYRWTVSTQQARWVAERIWPWLRIKQRQAHAIIELARHRADCQARGRYAPIKAEWITYRQTICDAVRAWNARKSHAWQPPLADVVELPRDPRRVPPKSLAGLPWRYALACIDDLGLILRAEVIWSKPNGLPESVTDRVRRSHEQFFHFTKEPRYFAAVDEIRDEHVGTTRPQAPRTMHSGNGLTHRVGGTDGASLNPLGKLPGSVREVPSAPLTVPAHLGVDHFAAFPPAWPSWIIRGWSPTGTCTACDEPRRPIADVESERLTGSHGTHRGFIDGAEPFGNSRGINAPGAPRLRQSVTITGYRCGCDTDWPHGSVQPSTRPAVVLDPFGGTGTTAMAARALGRHGISVDLSNDYCRLARWRVTDLDQLAAVRGLPRTGRSDDQQPSLLDLIGEATA